MGRMGHFAGKRVSKQHSTVIEAAHEVVKFLHTLTEVSKIALGRIDVHLPPTEKRIKFSEIRGGLKLQIRGTNSIQQIMVYSTDVASVKEKIEKEFLNSYIFIS
jgi:hypothetical protein